VKRKCHWCGKEVKVARDGFLVCPACKWSEREAVRNAVERDRQRLAADLRGELPTRRFP